MASLLSLFKSHRLHSAAPIFVDAAFSPAIG
jgi:hypothetical protein